VLVQFDQPQAIKRKPRAFTQRDNAWHSVRNRENYLIRCCQSGPNTYSAAIEYCWLKHSLDWIYLCANLRRRTSKRCQERRGEDALRRAEADPASWVEEWMRVRTVGGCRRLWFGTEESHEGKTPKERVPRNEQRVSSILTPSSSTARNVESGTKRGESWNRTCGSEQGTF
jgi:hypothetical protein